MASGAIFLCFNLFSGRSGKAALSASKSAINHDSVSSIANRNKTFGRLFTSVLKQRFNCASKLRARWAHHWRLQLTLQCALALIRIEMIAKPQAAHRQILRVERGYIWDISRASEPAGTIAVLL